MKDSCCCRETWPGLKNWVPTSKALRRENIKRELWKSRFTFFFLQTDRQIEQTTFSIVEELMPQEGK